MAAIDARKVVDLCGGLHASGSSTSSPPVYRTSNAPAKSNNTTVINNTTVVAPPVFGGFGYGFGFPVFMPVRCWMLAVKAYVSCCVFPTAGLWLQRLFLHLHHYGAKRVIERRCHNTRTHTQPRRWCLLSLQL